MTSPAPEDQLVVFEWPLWGLSLDCQPGVSNALRVLDGLLYQPTWAEWFECERSHIVAELAWGDDMLEANGQDASPPPLAVLSRLSPVDATGAPNPTWEEQQTVCRQVVAGLRLHSAGDFVDPQETCAYATFPSGVVGRVPRPLRAAFYDHEFGDPYWLGVADLERLLPLVRGAGVVWGDPQHINAAIALESFCLSFGAITPGGERGLHHFIALEALLGRFAPQGRGAFHRRASHAAEAVEGGAEWLEGAVSMRNQLAHSLHTYRPDLGDLMMLEEITRAVLVAYLSFISKRTMTHPLAGFAAALDEGPISLDLPEEQP